MQTRIIKKNELKAQKNKTPHFYNNVISKNILPKIKAGNDFIITEDCIDM